MIERIEQLDPVSQYGSRFIDKQTPFLSQDQVYLSEEAKTVLLHNEGLTAREIANQLEISEAEVDQNLHITEEVTQSQDQATSATSQSTQTANSNQATDSNSNANAVQYQTAAAAA